MRRSDKLIKNNINNGHVYTYVRDVPSHLDGKATEFVEHDDLFNGDPTTTRRTIGLA